jgi:hypothetical protein
LTAKSPFAVDLVAEDERIQEENRIRVAEEEARKNLAESRREKAKSEIILKVSPLSYNLVLIDTSGTLGIF